MRDFFFRVFFTFWAASLLMILGFWAVTEASDSRSLARRWLVDTVETLGPTAVDQFEFGGRDRLNGFLGALQDHSGIQAALVKDGVNLGSAPPPPTLAELIARAQEKRRPDYVFRSPWRGVVPMERGGGTYVFAAQMRPRRLLAQSLRSGATRIKFAVAGLISAALCWLLARNVTEPIGKLQAVARDIAGGNLSARAGPAVASGAPRVLASLAEDFDSMAARIQALMDQQKEFLRDISHELRSPLSRLGVSAELAQRGDLASAGRMEREIRILEGMISDLLTLARIDASVPASRRTHVHLGRLVQQVVMDASFEGLPDQKTVVQTGLFEAWVQGDPGLLHRCIENVVRNALGFTPPGGEVEVEIAASARSGLDGCLVSTRDGGAGVPDAALAHLFEPFYRVPGGKNATRAGAGLGLAISRKVAQCHGGAIEARNLAAGGLQVSLWLPLGLDPGKARGGERSGGLEGSKS